MVGVLAVSERLMAPPGARLAWRAGVDGGPAWSGAGGGGARAARLA
ncbi:MAG: hypothetical protein H0X57_16850 [Rubrobacter sp.]|nr:hypothetical protein [Rubrobacter sp.]